MKRIHTLLALPLALALAACSDTAPTAVADVGTLEARGGPPAAPADNVVDVALAVNAESGEFSTLIAAVVAAGLVDELSARGQRTVFAPVDAAFAELGLDAGNVGDLPVDVLRNILLYHVATGRRDAASVVGSDRIRMANGGFTDISLRADGAYIDEARIVATDVMATNGIIHVIDAVLIP